MLITQSQRAALDTLMQMGKLFFSGAKILPELQLQLQYYMLLVGPTGVGKSWVAATAADRLGATCLKLTRGNWIVVGSRNGRPTMYQIYDYACMFDRLVIFIDELDKFTRLQDGEWSASIASDLWAVLDGTFQYQIPGYLRETAFPDRKAPTVEELEARIRKAWIVGAGTWQEVYESRRADSAIGFGRGLNTDKVGMEAIVKSHAISAELLYRFNGDLIFLDWPSIEETRQLLKASGITQLAARLGVSIGPEAIDWAQGGMRALKTVAARLALAYERQKAGSRAKLPSDQAREAAAAEDHDCVIF